MATLTVNYATTRIVQAHPATLSGATRRDPCLHLVDHSRNLNTWCGLMVAEVLKHMPLSEFGRPGDCGFAWCPKCAGRLAARERRMPALPE